MSRRRIRLMYHDLKREVLQVLTLCSLFLLVIFQFSLFFHYLKINNTLINMFQLSCITILAIIASVLIYKAVRDGLYYPKKIKIWVLFNNDDANKDDIGKKDLTFIVFNGYENEITIKVTKNDVPILWARVPSMSLTKFEVNHNAERLVIYVGDQEYEVNLKEKLFKEGK